MINPSLQLVATDSLALPSEFSFSRESAAATINKLGALDVIADNTIRPTYDINTREFLGYHLEEMSANLITTNNRDLTDLWAYTTNTTLILGVAGSGIKDIGTMYDKATIVETTSSGVGKVTRTISGLTQGSQYTLSCYVKRITGASNIQLITNNTVGGITNVVTSTTDYIRIYQGFTANATSSTIGIYVPTGSKIYVDYFQLELGALSSPIFANANPRSKDALYITDRTLFRKLIDIYKGTFFIHFKSSKNAVKMNAARYGLFSTGRDLVSTENDVIGKMLGLFVLATSNNTSNKIVAMQGDESSNTLAATPYIYGATNTDSIEVSINDANNSWHKVAVSYTSGGNLRLCVDGGTIVTSSKTTFTNLGISTNSLYKHLRIGSASWSEYTESVVSAYTTNLDGFLRHFAYFPTVLSDDDMKSITT